MLIYERNVHKINKTLSQLGAEKIAFPPKFDAYVQADISTYRVASLLKIGKNITKNLRWQSGLYIY